MKVLSDNICKSLTNEFNNLDIKLFKQQKINENIVNNTNNYIRIIPKGIRGFLWFKRYNNNDYCYFLKKNYKNYHIYDCYKFNASFDKFLSNNLGTIIYGTLSNIENVNFFISDTLYYLKGEKYNVINNNLLNNVINKYTRPLFLTNDDICIMNSIYTKMENINKIYEEINYSIYMFVIYNEKHKKSYNIKPEDYFNILDKKVNKTNKTNNFMKIYTLQALVEDDLYLVYDNGKSMGYADISDYKTSVMLNNEFRNIKENQNLDLLEESDDEEEFENIDINKYVNLDKKVKFKCTYNKRFKLWKPIEKY
jgi:hypothetical protein